MNLGLALTEPQEDFVFSGKKYPLFVGGFGAGKSQSLIARSLLQLIQTKTDQGYFAPTYDLIRLIAWPRYQSMLTDWGLKFEPNKSDGTITVDGFGKIIFRSMDKPDGIVGFEIADAVIDELDTLRIEHARNAWNKIIARCRQQKSDGTRNTTAVGTTPEGFNCYDRWVRHCSESYGIYRALLHRIRIYPMTTWTGCVKLIRRNYWRRILMVSLSTLQAAAYI